MKLLILFSTLVLSSSVMANTIYSVNEYNTKISIDLERTSVTEGMLDVLNIEGPTGVEPDGELRNLIESEISQYSVEELAKVTNNKLYSKEITSFKIKSCVAKSSGFAWSYKRLKEVDCYVRFFERSNNN